MKSTLMLLMAIVTAWSVCDSFATVISDGGISIKLKDQHLIVMASEFSVSVKILRNATGHQIGLDGVSPLMLDWLSRRYKFKYSILEANVTTLDGGGPQFPGLVSYALRGECDLIMSSMFQTSERLRSLEMVHPWFYTNMAFLIPIPGDIKNNVDAVIKPFQFWVWMGLLVASAAIIITVLSFNRVLKFKILSIMYQNEEMNHRGLRQVGVRENIFTYIITTLLNQGGYISCKITPIRLVIGSWCLLTLVLLNVYNGVLISYVTATHREPPLIKSMEDAAFDSNIRVITNKGQGPDVVFSTATSGLYKAIGDKLRAYPMSRCNRPITQQCVDLVKSLPAQHVYYNGVTVLKSAIKDDYGKSHQCKTIIAATDTSNRAASWGLAKKSPHLETFNRGILELHEKGLISLWMKQFEPNTKPCYSEIKNSDKNNKTRKRLSLPNLMGAFALLAFGCLFSLLVFLAEMTISYLKTNSVIVV